MKNAGRWVRRMIAASPIRALAPETVWASLEEHAGRGPLGVGRTKDVLDVIEAQLADHKGGASMRGLLNAAVGYLEKTQEDVAAACATPVQNMPYVVRDEAKHFPSNS